MIGKPKKQAVAELPSLNTIEKGKGQCLALEVG